jgi:hypothetical protein
MKYSKEKLEKIITNSNNFSDVVRKLGMKPFYGNRQTVKKYVELYRLDITHFRKSSPGRKGDGKKFLLENILVENSTYIYTASLKERLYKEGIKERKCEMCGQGELWMGKKISLILDHINGCNTDNRIGNLRIVCPNCNASLPTHGGKNIKRQDKVSNRCGCGKETYGNNKVCSSCSQINQRKVKRPDYETLLEEIKNLGYTGTGLKYGVSDNAIRKWKKYYEKISIK